MNSRDEIALRLHGLKYEDLDAWGRDNVDRSIHLASIPLENEPVYNTDQFETRKTLSEVLSRMDDLERKLDELLDLLEVRLR